MQFKLLTALTAALSISQVAAKITPNFIVFTLNDITDLSADTAEVAKDIKGVKVFRSAPKLINNFKGIISTVTKTIGTVSDSPNPPPFSYSDQLDICTAFRDFVKVHQNLLSIVIGKNGLLSGTPFTAPIGAVLRVLEGGVDTLALTIIGFVPGCADGARQDLAALDNSLGDAINAYS